MLILASVMLAISGLACCCFPVSIPDIELPDVELPDIDIPQVEVGPMQEYDEEIPLDGTDEVEVEIRLGAGEISLAVGDPDLLFQGHFRTNVAEWAPEVTWAGSVLRIEQGDSVSIGIPNASDVGNEWELSFSPEVPLEMNVEIGASDGELDFTGLALTGLALDTGASDLEIRFDEPNLAEMDDLRIRAGAANLLVEGIGNASPERVRIEGGVGDLTLDFTGDWAGSARVEITTGAGSLTLRLPEDVGVRVEIEGGLSTIDADAGLTRSGDAYVNQAYGETETELVIEVTIGVGSVELELVGE